ncbi:MAG: GTPase HflX [Raineya sp.]|jgi:GTP-binding protein HflX|nr:GTPase HflX [Raineya sp.]
MIEKKKFPETKAQKEKTILVAVHTPEQTTEQTKEYLDELAFLAETANIEVVKRFIQNLQKPHPKTYLGTGKIQEIAEYIQSNKVETVIFDDDLSPSQVKHLEEILKCKILDRSLLILNIFALRAKTAQAKTQVELAQYQYILPRLTRMWTHLSKQKGGVGMRGPGEKELETDRRIVNDKISLLKEKLKQIEKQSDTRRKARRNMVRVALVGYTNVGKSTLMNLLSKSDVFAENKLFATVDSTVRKVVIDQIPFLLTDTVGFIRKLPTTLIECFKSTLDEIVEADILLHVVDISHSSFEEQISVVNQTLTDIKATDKKVILVFNKIDALKARWEQAEEEPSFTLEELKNSYLKKNLAQEVIFVSALAKENIQEFRKLIIDVVSERYFQIYPNFLREDFGWHLLQEFE